MGIITDIITLPFKIIGAIFKLIAATIDAAIGLVVAIVDLLFWVIEGTLRLCMFILTLPFKILGAVLPPYGASSGSDSNSRKGRAK